MLRWLVLAVVLAMPGRVDGDETGVLRVDYPGFTLWLDCIERGAVRFHYSTDADQGVLPREHRFTLDPDLPAHCQQTSTASYRQAGERYDRGHLVPANHLDHLADGIRLSNRMTNILPQASRMNRGAWLRTEELIECYRDIEPLEVWGGVLWGFDESNDHFVATHGVRTPDWFWKVIIAKGNPGRHIAWIVPNRHDATASKLDEYLVPVADIEFFTGLVLPVIAGTRTVMPVTSWPMPGDCNRG